VGSKELGTILKIGNVTEQMDDSNDSEFEEESRTNILFNQCMHEMVHDCIMLLNNANLRCSSCDYLLIPDQNVYRCNECLILLCIDCYNDFKKYNDL
jgi:hypothetical protein